MQADLSFLNQKVWEAANRSPLQSDVQSIALEPDIDFAGDQFLRIEVRLKPGSKPTDVKLLALLQAISGEVTEVDERYPSVRFPNAA